MAAAALFARGKSQASVARQLNVSRPSALRWYRAWHRHGRSGLRATGRAGRKPRLDATARQRLSDTLLRGARAAGFRTEVWTLERVGAVIAEVCHGAHLDTAAIMEG